MYGKCNINIRQYCPHTHTVRNTTGDGDINNIAIFHEDHITITDSGININDIPEITAGTDNVLVKYDGTSDLQPTGITIDDSDNMLGVTTINTHDPDDWVKGPTASTDTGIAVYDGITGKLIKNSDITIDASNNLTTSGNIQTDNIVSNTGSGTGVNIDNVNVDDQDISNVNTLNGYDPDDWVRGPASASAGYIARYNGISGKIIMNSNILIDDFGTMVIDPTESILVNQLHSASNTYVNVEQIGFGYDSLKFNNQIASQPSASNSLWINSSNGHVYRDNVDLEEAGLSVTGTDNTIVRMNGTDDIQDSGITIDDNDNVENVNSLSLADTGTNPGSTHTIWRDTNTILWGGKVFVLAEDAVKTSNSIAKWNSTNVVEDTGITIDASDNIDNVQSITFDSNVSNPGTAETLWRGTSAGELNYSDKYITYTDNSGKTANYIATWADDRRLSQITYMSGSGTLTFNADAGTPTSISVDYWYNRIGDIVTLIIDRYNTTMSGVNNYTSTTGLASDIRPSSIVWQVIHVDTGTQPDSDILGNLNIFSTSGVIVIYREHGGGQWSAGGSGWQQINTSYHV